MYNDYYLQEISTKLSTTNNNLETIIQNQTTILANQEAIFQLIGIIILIIATYLIYNFVVRCLK